MSKKEILEFKSAPRLERGATIVPSRWSIAIIASDDELILPHRANRADGDFSGTTTLIRKLCGGPHDQSDFQPAAFASSLQGIRLPNTGFDGRAAKFFRQLIF